MHFDLRMEISGVLVSWAVPKGPTYNTKEMHLAVNVEDHPLEYGSFEGVIPAGEYGGGPVIIWDKGTYQPLKKKKFTKADLKTGLMEFTLYGEKLKGNWVLFQLKGRGKNNWILKKMKGPVKGPMNITKSKPRSVVSGMTVHEMGKMPDGYSYTPEFDPANIKGATKTKIFPISKPVKPELLKKPFDSPDYVYELKFDGMRIIATKNGKQLALQTRNVKNVSKRFPEVAKELAALPCRQCILDGEIVSVRDGKVRGFEYLQNRIGITDEKTIKSRLQTNPVAFFVFDIIYLDGYDLRRVPLVTRKSILENIVDSKGSVQYVSYIEKDGTKFFQAARRKKLEGVVAKKADGTYTETGALWKKFKVTQRQEFLICGWTEGRGSRAQTFGSLILCATDPKTKKPIHVGEVGTGFTEETLRDLSKKLRRNERKTSPFAGPIKILGTPHWTTPKHIAEISFAEWTSGNKLRTPSFLGLRYDKKPKDVIIEKAR